MGRFGDWAKGPWRDTVRVKVSYEIVTISGRADRYEIITVVPKQSLNFNRDAKERVEKTLTRTVKPPDYFRILTTTVEGGVPFIHPAKSW